jgi:hypothetical protein
MTKKMTGLSPTKIVEFRRKQESEQMPEHLPVKEDLAQTAPLHPYEKAYVD